ncbi:MAG: carboxypeptidase-like regulatory domain-containing protein, partial [Pyrinomonadaceae bacterium]
MRKFTKFLIVGLALLTTQIAIHAQTTGSMSGTVTDPSGAVVPGATVTVVNTATGAERSAVASSTGAFDFQALQPGNYTISVEASGFRKAIARNIVVSVSTASTVNIPLEVGLAGEEVTV